jgi:hypothetical protein
MIRMTIQDNIHTLIVAVALIAAILVRSLDPTAVPEELVTLLVGGMLGTAGTKAPR